MHSWSQPVVLGHECQALPSQCLKAGPCSQTRVTHRLVGHYHYKVVQSFEQNSAHSTSCNDKSDGDQKAHGSGMGSAVLDATENLFRDPLA